MIRASLMTTIEFPQFHPSQRAVASSTARFRVLATGRRWGKTVLGSALCVAEGLRFGGRAWWVAPTYQVAMVGWRMIRKLSYQLPGVEIRKGDMQIMFPGGGEVRIRSADNPDGLRGEGLDLVVMDECAFIHEDAWTEALRPALSDRQGRAVFISTPKARNWFWHLWQRGIAGEDGWQSWQLPTSDNPYIAAEEIEEARRNLPELTFRQEYLAEFLEHEGAVFRNIGACLGAPETTPTEHAGHKVVAGIDWAKSGDFSCISVVCADCKQELELDRFNQIDYIFQRGRVAVLIDKWGVAEVLAETNSIGEPLLEELQNEGLPVRGFQTTPTSKPKLIESLALAFEREEIQWLNIPVATVELEAYERRVNQTTGRSSYSAPEGGHDDTVIARALANYNLDTWHGIYI